jgi:hypothetical protein
MLPIPSANATPSQAAGRQRLQARSNNERKAVSVTPFVPMLMPAWLKRGSA